MCVVNYIIDPDSLSGKGPDRFFLPVGVVFLVFDPDPQRRFKH